MVRSSIAIEASIVLSVGSNHFLKEPFELRLLQPSRNLEPATWYRKLPGLADETFQLLL